MLVDAAVGLGEPAFNLLVLPLAAGHFQHFHYMICLQHTFLAAAAADQLYPELLGQCEGGSIPGVVQWAVVAQGDQCLAR